MRSMCFDLLQQSQSYITIPSIINSIEQSLPGVIDYLDHKEKGLRALVGGGMYRLTHEQIPLYSNDGR